MVITVDTEYLMKKDGQLGAKKSFEKWPMLRRRIIC